jgi:hypothetical protein
MRVTVYRSNTSGYAARVDATISALHAVQSRFHFTISDADLLAPKRRNIDPLATLEEIEGANGPKPFIAVVDDPFTDNWFSHETRSGSIITTSDWENHFAPPSLRSYLAYQIAQALAYYAAEISEESATRMFVHYPSAGCLFDLSIQKRDIKYGMLAGNLCASCRGSLRALGAAEEDLHAIEAILDWVRAEATARPSLIDPCAVFVIMRFSTNDENDNAWKYGIAPALESFGYQAERGDSSLRSGQLLDKVARHIKRARLVVAKIDEKNLNVYFELGLAMGMDKPVVLITEKEFVVDVPTDLRNWECLSYSRGNYDQLRERLVRFCLQNFPPVNAPPVA